MARRRLHQLRDEFINTLHSLTAADKPTSDLNLSVELETSLHSIPKMITMLERDGRLRVVRRGTPHRCTKYEVL